MKLILIFMGITKKKKVDKSKRKYIFKIDVYFTEYFLVVEIDEKTTKAEILFLKKKKKRQEASEKNLIAYLLELIQATQKEVTIQTMKLVKYKYLSVNLKKK